MVRDFADEADETKAAFEPYYETTLLCEATDPNLLYNIQNSQDDKAITHAALKHSRGVSEHRRAVIS